MTIKVDELQVSSLKVGQSVQVTADAVKDKTYEGLVTRVSMKGDTSGGTTTYPVTVRIDETTGLRPGMNANAEIVVALRPKMRLPCLTPPLCGAAMCWCGRILPAP
ncbi:MAG: HlyD family efflux transporter periplasmic adaptor subunit [Faecalibacterium sp.]